MSALSSTPSSTPSTAGSSAHRLSRRAVPKVALAVLSLAALSACGKSEGPVAAPETSSDAPGAVAETGSDTGTAANPSSETAAGASSDAATGDASQPTVVATVPTSLPKEAEGQVGKVTVIGTPLPQIGRESVEADPARGLKAPILIGSTFSGEELRIDAVSTGRPTLIYFMAHWCPHCNNEIPVLNDIRDSNGFRPDLDVYGVSTGVDASKPNFPPSKWIEKMDWTYPTMVDGVADGNKGFLAYNSFGAGGFPMAVLINADGTVAARWTGEKSAEETLANIENYLAY